MARRYTVLHRRLMVLLLNSLGTNQYRAYYLEQDGEAVDVTQDGELSCAFFVSAILRMATLPDEPPLIESVCLNNEALIEQLVVAGWEEVDLNTSPPKPGMVVIYDWQDGHRHSGVVCAPDEVISNSSELRQPDKHHLTFNGSHGILRVFWHPSFTVQGNVDWSLEASRTVLAAARAKASGDGMPYPDHEGDW